MDDGHRPNTPEESAVTTWSSTDARAIAGAEEIGIATRRPDGTLRRPRIIWVVGDGDRLFVRSTNGRAADWFRGALSSMSGQLLAGGAFDVVFTEAADADLPVVDAAYRAKYGRYAGIVDHLIEPGPRAATLQVHPA